MKPVVFYTPFVLHAVTAAVLPLSAAPTSSAVPHHHALHPPTNPQDHGPNDPVQGVKEAPPTDSLPTPVERRNINGVSVARLTQEQLCELLAQLLAVQGQVSPVLTLLPPTATAVPNGGLLGGLLGGLDGLLPPLDSLLGQVISLLLPGHPSPGTGPVVGIPVAPVPVIGNPVPVTTTIQVPTSVIYDPWSHIGPVLLYQLNYLSQLTGPSQIVSTAAQIVQDILSSVVSPVPPLLPTNLPWLGQITTTCTTAVVTQVVGDVTRVVTTTVTQTVPAGQITGGQPGISLPVGLPGVTAGISAGIPGVDGGGITVGASINLPGGLDPGITLAIPPLIPSLSLPIISLPGVTIPGIITIPEIITNGGGGTPTGAAPITNRSVAASIESPSTIISVLPIGGSAGPVVNLSSVLNPVLSTAVPSVVSNIGGGLGTLISQIFGGGGSTSTTRPTTTTSATSTTSPPTTTAPTSTTRASTTTGVDLEDIVTGIGGGVNTFLCAIFSNCPQATTTRPASASITTSGTTTRPTTTTSAVTTSATSTTRPSTTTAPTSTTRASTTATGADLEDIITGIDNNDTTCIGVYICFCGHDQCNKHDEASHNDDNTSLGNNRVGPGGFFLFLLWQLPTVNDHAACIRVYECCCVSHNKTHDYRGGHFYGGHNQRNKHKKTTSDFWWWRANHEHHEAAIDVGKRVYPRYYHPVTVDTGCHAADSVCSIRFGAFDLHPIALNTPDFDTVLVGAITVDSEHLSAPGVSSVTYDTIAINPQHFTPAGAYSIVADTATVNPQHLAAASVYPVTPAGVTAEPDNPAHLGIPSASIDPGIFPSLEVSVLPTVLPPLPTLVPSLPVSGLPTLVISIPSSLPTFIPSLLPTIVPPPPQLTELLPPIELPTLAPTIISELPTLVPSIPLSLLLTSLPNPVEQLTSLLPPIGLPTLVPSLPLTGLPTLVPSIPIDIPVSEMISILPGPLRWFRLFRFEVPSLTFSIPLEIPTIDILGLTSLLSGLPTLVPSLPISGLPTLVPSILIEIPTVLPSIEIPISEIVSVLPITGLPTLVPSIPIEIPSVLPSISLPISEIISVLPITGLPASVPSLPISSLPTLVPSLPIEVPSISLSISEIVSVLPVIGLQSLPASEIISQITGGVGPVITGLPTMPISEVLSQISGVVDSVITALPTLPIPSLPLTEILSISSSTLIAPRPLPTNTTSILPPSYDNPRNYLFHPRASTNVAVYFGQSAATTRTSLLDQCADPNIDMVILGFLTSINDANSGWPRLELSAACPSYQTVQMLAVAPGLAYFPYLEEDIVKCQTKYGKKVTLSLGGAGSILPLSSDIEAITFADKLFGLFGPRGYVDSGLRPFGEAVIDGFDLDKSDGRPAHWDTFAAQLRARFASDGSKDYYLTAAPGCSFPDASIPLGYLVQSNFVWPQFFNNPACEIGSDGFPDSLRQWSQALSSGVAPLRDSSALRTRFYVGTPAWLAAGPSAYAGFGGRPRGLLTLAQQVKAYSYGNLGGMMFWDGPEGQENVQDGLSILGWAKRGLWGW
ncbi:hypothetical protein OQA88_10520 [Cercophora sp. LCS_1]